MATINNLSQVGKFSSKTNVSKLSFDKLEKSISKDALNEQVETFGTFSSFSSFDDSFSYKSSETFGGYTKESLTSTNQEVAEEVVDSLVDSSTEKTSKGIDTSKFTSKKNSSMKIDVSDLKTEQLVNFQNMIQKMINNLAGEDGKIPDSVQKAAQASLEGDGFWSPESVSGRILDMAKALSGGDPDKFELLKEAVLKGFGAAADEWGDDLPEITNVTLDLVMKGFDDWYSELN